MKHIAYIFVSGGADPAVHNGEFVTEQHCMKVVGVPDIAAGCKAAKLLVEQGCRVIELCGGFGAEGAQRVIDAIHCDVPVGYIEFPPEENEKRLEQRRREQAGSQNA